MTFPKRSWTGFLVTSSAKYGRKTANCMSLIRLQPSKGASIGTLRNREKLKAARKMLKKGGKPNAPEPLEKEDLEKLWATGALRDGTPETLQDTIWYLLTLHMGMRGRDEHYKLLYGDFDVKSTTDGSKYVEFNE